MNLLSAWHRVAGAGLLALTVLPTYRLLAGRRIGLSGRDTLGAADRAYDILLLGALIVIVAAVLASRVLASGTVEAWLQRVRSVLLRPSSGIFAALVGGLCTVLTAAFAVLVLEGKPNLVDSMVQLLHARFFAEGMLSGPATSTVSFWHLQNSVVTPEGWVSHFPPGFTALLAAGHLLRATWLITAVAAGVAVAFTSLAAERLIPERRAAVRLGALLAAQSPFLIGLAGAQMNHAAAGAFIAIAMYAAARGRTPAHPGWALLAGAALGAAFTVRPFAGLVAAVPVLVIAFHDRGQGMRPSVTRLVAGLVGAVPFGLAVAWYNARFFGGPTRFGYEYAFGPGVGLGFHTDPWGNRFGPVEALGYTSSDLTTLGLNLLESPVSVVAIVGIWLLVTRRLSSGERVVALWALLPVAANFFYWHHGIFMGPRMLNEVAPPWCVLVALSFGGILRALPANLEFRGYHARTAAAVAFALTVAAGTFYQGPERLIGYGGYMQSSRIDPPAAPDSSLVFVHGAWTSRVVSRLAAAGMRLDSIDTALRQNGTCEVHEFSRRFTLSAPNTAQLDFDIESGRELPQRWVRDDYMIREGSGRLTPDCVRELHADRLGTVDVSPMLWQVRVPGLRSGGAVVVRDMGPAENGRLMARFPSLTALMYHRRSPDAEPVLSPYQTAVREIWGE